MSELGIHKNQKNAHGGPAGQGAVAIIGMSCLFPGAPDLDAYWRNILNKVDAVTDPPPESWHNDRYFDPDSGESDRIYCKRGGYLGPLISFDPLAHGVPPVAVGGEPDQWLALQLAADAMADAGYTELDEAVRKRTAVILGKGTYLNGGNAMAVQHGLVLGQTLALLKTLHPEYTDEELEVLRQELKKSLPPLGPETVPGLIPNIIVGRIANRLDLMGPAYTVDAACASSLVAVQMALRDLAEGACDMALVGGSQVWIPSPTMNVFCQLGALSRRQQIRPFDKDADGTLLGEGIGMVVLKRLGDAERDGDRIYAVIRGVGVASDGRGVTVMAPRVEGEELALWRAYEAAGVAPSTVGLIEAHGTGTPVGDLVEIQALSRVFGPRGDGLPWCALGSVKSMISHTIPASGVAGIIKTALALYHKVLPPMLNCTEPNPKLELEKTPFYLNTETRPWVHRGSEPRRAGVNSFGFGGINAHAVLEEYVPGSGNDRERARRDPSRSADHRPDWESEVCLLGAGSPVQLLEDVRRLEGILGSALSRGGEVRLKDLAYTLNRDLMESGAENASRLAIVATSVTDLREKLSRAALALDRPNCRRIRDVSGIYFEAEPMGREGKLVFLFPGEGAQYPNMLADLCLHFPEVRECFDQADRAYAAHPRGYVPSDVIFPRPSLGDREDWAKGRLWAMDGAIEAVLTADLALLAVLNELGLRPDAIVGHSSGEYAALRAAGLLDIRTEEQWAWFAHELNRDYEQAAACDGVPRAVLLAVGAGRERAESIAREAGGEIHVAMDNCPHQVVLAGETGAIERAMEIVRREGLMAERLSFDRPYHTPMFAPFAEHLREVIDQLPIGSGEVPLYSCTSVAPFPKEPVEIRSLMIEHWLRPVEFCRTIEALYDEGARIFVEVGPRGNLTAFVEDILRGRASCAVPSDTPRRSSLTQLNHLVGLLTAQGVNTDLMYLHRRRDSRPVALDGLAREPVPARPGMKLKLDAGFPEMRLSDEVVQRLRVARSADAPRPQHAHSPDPPLADGPGPRDVQSEVVPEQPPVASLPQTGEDYSPAPAAEVPAWPAMPGSSGVPPAFVAGEMPSAFGAYFQTMEQFLGLQQRVIRGCLRPVPSSDLATKHGDQAGVPRAVTTIDPEYPMLGEVVEWRPGEGLVVRRTFDPSEDLYLDHHTLGRDVSRADPDLRALAIMPMTMSLEILAEAASALMPGRTVIGLREVRASRWISFEDGPRTLQVTARVLPGDGEEVAAQLRNLTEDSQGGDPPKSPVIEATVVFSDSYPQPTGETLSSLVDGRPSRLHPGSLYDEHMFHGPLWQGVAAIEQTGESGAVARLRVLPTRDYFASDPDPRFVLDPAVLDAAGQVIGFWTIENLDRGKIVFPFRMEALELYGARRPSGESLACGASIRLVGDHQVRSDIDVLDADGRLWMRLIGWEDKRFDLPDKLTPLILPKRRADVSESWPEPIAHFPRPELFECRWMRADFPSDRGFWARVWVHRMLGRAERALFRRLRAPESRRLEWLAGRAAAKEAARCLLDAHYGLDLPLADIEILPDEWGRPRAVGAWRDLVDGSLSVTISHVDGLAVAVAGLAPAMSDVLLLGIDVESVRPLAPGFADAAFDGPEAEILRNFPLESREEWMLRLWCAKEAVAKALGRGLVEGPRSVRLGTFDLASETVCVRLGDRLTSAIPGLTSSKLLSVSTGRYGNLVMATTLCESVDAESVGHGAASVLR